MNELIYSEAKKFANESFIDILEKNDLKIMQKVSFLLDFYSFEDCKEIDKIIILLSIAKVTVEKYSYIDERIRKQLLDILIDKDISYLKEVVEQKEYIEILSDMSNIEI